MSPQCLDALAVERTDFDLVLAKSEFDPFAYAGVLAADGFPRCAKNRNIIDIDLITLEWVMLIGEFGLDLGEFAILLRRKEMRLGRR
jgi:hypothetical protein